MTLVVDTEAMRAHARDVRVLASDLDEALDAGLTAALDTGAFGLICSFLVPLTSTVQLAGVAALAASSASMDSIADGLTLSADGYDAVDGATHGALTKILEEMTP